jgi:hypothetical protein
MSKIETSEEFAQRCHDKIMDYDPPRYSDITKVIREVEFNLEQKTKDITDLGDKALALANAMKSIALAVGMTDDHSISAIVKRVQLLGSLTLEP